MGVEEKLTDEEFKYIEANLRLNIMKSIIEDKAYDNDEKYLILEGIISTWGKEQKRNPPT